MCPDGVKRASTPGAGLKVLPKSTRVTCASARGVLGRVERQRRRVLARVVPIGELGLLLLQVGGVRQHDREQIGGAAGGVDRPREAVTAEPRQVAGVIDVRVAQDDRVEALRVDGRRRPVAQPQRLQPLE